MPNIIIYLYMNTIIINFHIYINNSLDFILSNFSVHRMDLWPGLFLSNLGFLIGFFVFPPFFPGISSTLISDFSILIHSTLLILSDSWIRTATKFSDSLICYFFEFFNYNFIFSFISKSRDCCFKVHIVRKSL